MNFLCLSEYASKMIEADSLIEAVMQFYREEDDFPFEVSSRYGGDRLKRLEDEVEDIQELLDIRTEERDLAVRKLNELFYLAKEALATE